MKLFEPDLRNLKRMGVTEMQTNQENLFNKTNMLVLCVFGVGALSACAQFFFVAESFQEYTDSAFIAVTNMVAFVIFAYAIFKRQLMFDIIQNGELLINERECIFYNWHEFEACKELEIEKLYYN